ncbi:protein downstream neighbor of Son-like [Vitis riparia]|uniref:protein downstream neighbor of Son-like n=1 Tax=Vitis riparia TaxID=96939 RepID=UPI00155B2F75|nr:protein downstream neighbor of Son-like [Vitis riparia]
MDGVFPAKKSRFRMLSGKENAKEDISAAPAGCLKNICVSLNSVVKSHPQLSCPENTVVSAAVSKDGTRQDCEYAEKCSQSTFRSVAELSLGSERISEMAVVDMDKALKGLVACEPRAFSGLAADSSEKFGNFTSISSGHFCSEFHIPGQKAPLDFTLKTNMQIVSSSSVNWFHRLNMSATYNGTTLSTPQFGCSKDQNISCSSGITSTAQIFNYRALHSWVHPQSSLPPSVISAWTLSAADGVNLVETDFLIKRQLAWEDSFRSLYYMLRKNICNIFYVCTSQFVVVFASGDGSGEKKQSSNAYISQSTRGLRIPKSPCPGVPSQRKTQIEYRPA